MEITITDKGMIKLTSSSVLIQQTYFTISNVYKEEFTPYELDQLIDKLKKASKEARYKQKGIKI